MNSSPVKYSDIQEEYDEFIGLLQNNIHWITEQSDELFEALDSFETKNKKGFEELLSEVSDLFRVESETWTDDYDNGEYYFINVVILIIRDQSSMAVIQDFIEENVPEMANSIVPEENEIRLNTSKKITLEYRNTVIRY